MGVLQQLSKNGPLVDCKTGQQSSLSQLKFKYLGLYFTAVWCSYCVQIVNKLPKIIEKVNQKGQFFKMITLRLDQQDSQFAYSYLRFKNITYQGSEHLARIFGARQIPSVFVFDLAGRLVTRSGLQDIMTYQENTIEYWDKKMGLV